MATAPKTIGRLQHYAWAADPRTYTAQPLRILRLCCRQRAAKGKAPKGAASRRRQSQGSRKGGLPLSKLQQRRTQADGAKKARKLGGEKNELGSKSDHRSTNILDVCLGQQRVGVSNPTRTTYSALSLHSCSSRALSPCAAPRPPRLGGHCFWQESRSVSTPAAAGREAPACSTALHSIDSSRSCHSAGWDAGSRPIAPFCNRYRNGLQNRGRGWRRRPLRDPGGSRSRRRRRTGMTRSSVVVMQFRSRSTHKNATRVLHRCLVFKTHASLRP